MNWAPYENRTHCTSAEGEKLSPTIVLGMTQNTSDGEASILEI